MPLLFYARALLAALLATPVATAAAEPASLLRGPVEDAARETLSREDGVARHELVDQGAMAAETPLARVQLVLRRPAARQAALDALTRAQLEPGDPAFHQWVSPAAFGAAFGPAAADVAAVTRWLAQRGLDDVRVAPDRMSVTFAGTAGSVGAAFGTELHEYRRADGRTRHANATLPSVPAALAGVVAGVTLSDFFPTPNFSRVIATAVGTPTAGKGASAGAAAPDYTFSSGGKTYYAVTPQDLAVIYNFNPARQAAGGPPGPGGGFAALTGAGQTVLLAEQTDVLPGDWTLFRGATGLSQYPGTLTITHPGGCADPGRTADEGEAILDAEYSSAAAPGAKIVLAACAGTSPFEFGVLTALQAAVNQTPVVQVISVSYGGCEAENGGAFTDAFTNAVQQGAAEGISIFVSSGDGAVAGCDASNAKAAKLGLGVNALAASPYVTSVGGTDFSDSADSTVANYWNTSVGAYGLTAKSYIPEIPWDDSCASSVLWTYAKAKDAIAYCNQAGQKNLDITGGSGGPSTLYAKPSYQSGVPGIPNDGARGQPDVSFFASNGIWSHFYVICFSDTAQGGVPCDYSNPANTLNLAYGGTSFAAPIMAGVQAMVTQSKGANVGNAAPRLYQLGVEQFNYPGAVAGCDSSLGTAGNPICIFHVVTRGTNAVVCQKGTPNCFSNAESTAGYGVSSTSTASEQDAYPTRNGWSFATGLGSLNVTQYITYY